MRAEHIGRDKARSGVVALVAQYAVELERVADRFMDLQHHLVGHQQQIHAAGWTIRRREQLQGFIREALAAPYEPIVWQTREITLLCVEESSRLRVAAFVRRDSRVRNRVNEALV